MLERAQTQADHDSVQNSRWFLSLTRIVTPDSEVLLSHLQLKCLPQSCCGSRWYQEGIEPPYFSNAPGARRAGHSSSTYLQNQASR